LEEVEVPVRRTISLGVLATLLTCLPVAAQDARPASMAVGSATLVPIGHAVLCRRMPSECAPYRKPSPAPVALDVATIEMVAAVNRDVNSAIKPVPDREWKGREESWDYPVDRGDCEDFALRKRQVLASRGIELANLLITVVKQRSGEGHAILTLRTDRGDFVLDNLDWTVRDWRETTYRFVKRQSTESPALWVSLLPAPAAAPPAPMLTADVGTDG
jgi:predicted transglutaminase-like cysteine proteinase